MSGGRLYRGWVRALRLLDLTGGDGGPSFSKFVLLAVFAALAAGGGLTDYTATLLVAASFGRPVLVKLLERATFGVTAAVSRVHALVEQRVAARRDPAAGIEATP